MCLAIPGKIIEITSDATHSALVDVMGVRRKVDLGLLQEDKSKTGDWVLIHVGFAMSKISEEEALDPDAYVADVGGKRSGDRTGSRL
jgi:hydrogenase expression/formation protein HypC